MFSDQKHVKVVTIRVFLKLHQLVINCCFMTSIVVTGEEVSLLTCELQLSSRLPQHKSHMYRGTREGVSVSERLRKHLPRFPHTAELFFLQPSSHFPSLLQFSKHVLSTPSLYSIPGPAGIITFLVFNSESALTHPGRHVNPPKKDRRQ